MDLHILTSAQPCLANGPISGTVASEDPHSHFLDAHCAQQKVKRGLGRVAVSKPKAMSLKTADTTKVPMRVRVPESLGTSLKQGASFKHLRTIDRLVPPARDPQLYPTA